MDFVEKGLNDVQEHMKESIQKHNDIFAKTIYNTAKKSNQCSNSFDRSFHKTFPESNNIGTEDEIFNPKAVFEFKEGVATDVIETWDKTLGILPNRKVMGSYHIDLSNSLSIQENPYKWISLIPGQISGNVQILDQNGRLSGGRFSNSSNGNMNQYQIHINGSNSGKTFHSGSDELYRCPPLNNRVVTRGEERTFENYTGNHDFEVDNYLNIYHKQSGLYLMLHKTTFPNICFYFAKQYTKLKGKDYYKIYESKRMETLGFELNGNYLSKDQRSSLISSVNTLLPENYKQVFELYNNFRKLQPIKQLSDGPVEEDISESNPEIDVTDPKDRIIEGLRNKLNKTVKRCENNEKIVSDMIEQYNNKSVDLQNLDREKNIVESKLSELKLVLEIKDKETKCEIDKMKHKCDTNITEIKESKDREKFEIYKRLSEAEVFRAKSDSLGISYESLKSNLEKETLEKKKIKDMNKALLTQFEQQKERNNKLTEDNNSLLKQLDEKIYLSDECRRIMDELNCKLDKKVKECLLLGEKLSQIGEKSDSALENALSDRVNDLEAEISELKIEKSQIVSNNKHLERDLEKIRGFMSNFH